MIDELQGQIDNIMNERNNREILEFEGYSPIEMTKIIYYTFDETCAINFMSLKSK